MRDRAGEPLAGEVRLQWWHDVLEGVRPQEAAANPVAAALLQSMAENGLAASSLLDLIGAREFDLYDDPMPTLAALEGYARRTTSALFLEAARLLGHGSVAEAADPAGVAYGITGLLRSFAFHASRRQLFVPVEILERHGVAIADIFAGRSSPQLGGALAELRGVARRHLEAVAARRLPAGTVAALLPVSLVRGYLDRMERHDYAPFASPVEVAQWRRQWALWRAARHDRV